MSLAVCDEIMSQISTLSRADPDAAPGKDVFLHRIRDVAESVARRARELDHDGAFPTEGITALGVMGALEAPLPAAFGGLGLGTAPAGALRLMQVLRILGHASLPLGRLYEGHVNALALISRFGTVMQMKKAARDAQSGLLFGVWNTEGKDGLKICEEAGAWRLEGRKIFASGAGHIGRALVTASTKEGASLMILTRLDKDREACRADLSGWVAHGMRASATGSYDFAGLVVDAGDLIGGNGDYHRQPYFTAGAWRFAAVQLGGIERLIDEARAHLSGAGRTGDPYQLARMGEAAIAAETAHLWVRRAAEMAEAGGRVRDPETIAAYVNLARSAVERAGLDTLELVHRSVGLAAFLRTHPIESVSRDLATYLRQPAPDRALAYSASHMLGRDTPTAELWS